MDTRIQAAVNEEIRRQEEGLELIASENYVSKEVLACQGTVLTNKYAEGYPGARHYPGCQNMDTIEELAQAYARDLFGAKYVNVQPYGGAEANMAVYNAILQPGATILCMSEPAGGHVSHGGAGSAASLYFHIETYGLDPATGLLDYEGLRKQAMTLHPDLIIAGASAYPRIIDFERIGAIAREAESLYMVDMAHIAGLVAAGLHPSPIPCADVVTTTTHKTLRGPRGGMILTQDPQIYAAVNRAIFPGLQGGPLMHVIAGKAQAFYEDLQPDFKGYAQAVIDNIRAMADEFMQEGFPVATGGSDNHLTIVQVTPAGLSGVEAEQLLDSLGISVNACPMPADPDPAQPTGIRLGSPALTTRGFTADDFRAIAQLIIRALRGHDQPEELAAVQGLARQLAKEHPLGYEAF